MEIEVKKYTDRELVLKLKGEDHTLGNLLAKHALSHPHVKLAAYVVEHPLEGSPTLRIVTDGQVDPVSILKEVVKNVKEMINDLTIEVSNVLGENL
ncbi:MAG: hypothetical protein B7O98_06065 [Zestosphaera tikiterensis]|uniref:DNA-directed RNA polymerase subunit Rpo11 n=1 Tax=Zestosphaera tikiterensis TaxID=1973259 RepID=A0A2R7Y5U0_9CREN|nr:MAG: hypothetical protein B7O98_06065 [Zestosphaera tikiterensis]